MNFLNEFQRLNIPVNWNTILIGWNGYKNHPRLLTVDDLNSYCIKVIELNKINSKEILFLAAGMPDANDTEIFQILNKLAVAEERADVKKEEEKWMVILLKNQLNNLPKDPFYSMLELMDFWHDSEFPPESSMNQLHNLIESEQIDTVEKFDDFKKQNYHWINQQILLLQKQ